MVLDDHFKLEKPFEGGIDWWLPKEEKITTRSDLSEVQKTQRWYKNGYNVPLSYGLSMRLGANAGKIGATDVKAKSGLNIFSPELITEMKLAEAKANTNFENVGIEDGVVEAFERKIRKRMGTRLARFIEEPNVVQFTNVIKFDFETVRAIRKVEFHMLREGLSLA